MAEVYYFQRSQIWEAGDPPDANSEIVRVKVQKGGPGRARRQLPSIGLGRVWVQVDQTGKVVPKCAPQTESMRGIYRDAAGAPKRGRTC
jgi:hypothetical protein